MSCICKICCISAALRRIADVLTFSVPGRSSGTVPEHSYVTSSTRATRLMDKTGRCPTVNPSSPPVERRTRRCMPVCMHACFACFRGTSWRFTPPRPHSFCVCVCVSHTRVKRDNVQCCCCCCCIQYIPVAHRHRLHCQPTSCVPHASAPWLRWIHSRPHHLVHLVGLHAAMPALPQGAAAAVAPPLATSVARLC